MLRLCCFGMMMMDYDNGVMVMYVGLKGFKGCIKCGVFVDYLFVECVCKGLVMRKICWV